MWIEVGSVGKKGQAGQQIHIQYEEVKVTSPILLTEQRENEIEVQQEREEEEEEQGGVVVQQINFISGLSTLLERKKSSG